MEADPQSELVDYFDVADVLLRLGVAPSELRVGLRLPGPSHIFGGYRHAVGPRDTRTQLEIERPAVRGTTRSSRRVVARRLADVRCSRPVSSKEV